MATQPGPWSYGETRNAPYTPMVVSYKNKSYPNGVTLFLNYTSGGVIASHSRTGVRTPGYHNLVRRRVLVPAQPASREDTLKVPGYYSAFHKYKSPEPASSFYRISGPFWQQPNLPVSWGTNIASFLGVNPTSTTSNKALSKLIKKAHDNTLEVIPFVGELGESVRMIGDRANKLASQIEKNYSADKLAKMQWHQQLLRARNPGGLRKKQFLSAVSQKASYWLEMCYGWNPLLQDIKHAAETVADVSEMSSGVYHPRRVSSHPQYSPVSSREQTVQQYDGKCADYTFHMSYASANVHRRQSYEVLYSYLSTIGLSAPSTMRYAADKAGLSWEDALPGAWELIPYSFVVDAFSNMGDIISAVSTSRGGWVNPCTSTVTSIREEVHLVAYNYANIWHSVSGGSGEPQKSSYFKFSRKLGIPTAPSFEVKVPNVGTALNLVALATSKITKLAKVLTF